MNETPVAVITGGSSGIGLATAIHFAKAGWRVAICGRNAERLRTAAQAISTQGMSARLDDESDISLATPLTRALDVGHVEAVVEFAKEVSSEFGRIDVWVNNSGVAPLGTISDLTFEQAKETWEVNCRAVFAATKAVWPVMTVQRSGLIINLSSLASVDPFAGFSLYGASKAWVNLFTLSTAREGETLGIRCMAVSPGAVETPLLRRLFPDFPADETLPPEAIAKVIWQLAVGEHDATSGEVVTVTKGS